VDHVGVVEEALPLLRSRAVADVGVLEDLGERAAAPVLADHVGGEAIDLVGTGKERREGIPEDLRQAAHEPRLLQTPRPRERTAVQSLGMRRRPSTARFAERVLHGVDDAGASERIVIWIERRPGAVWAVGRAVNPQYRPSDEPRPDDYIFEGYELDDALEHANGALRDDASVSAADGRSESPALFEREELLKPLERWFFGRR
jgi:hypothetical protein